MGLTESSSKQLDLQQKYKLIRRYTSDCYGDLTVIQSKESQKTYALKELVTEDDLIVKMIESRKKFKHKNLVMMEDFCFSGDQSICSNIRKIEMVFEYYGTSLDDEMKTRAEKNQIFIDAEIVQVLSDSIECLQYLQQMNFLHMLGSMKMILYDQQSKSIKIMENQELLVHSQRNKKKQINIIGLLGSKKMLPLHPLNEPRDVCDVCLTAEKVAHQNLFILGIICIGLCWMREPLELGIFGKGGYNFHKIQKRVGQVKNKFPYVHKILSLFMGQNKKPENSTYSNVLSEIQSIRKSFSKQNDRSQRLIEIQPVEKVGDKKPKKLSYLREMRLSNNDIPNQF